MAESVQDRVFEVVYDELGVEKEDITMETKLKDGLGMDSLDCVEMTMRVEEEFDLEIPDEDTEKIETVGDIVRYVQKKQEAAA